MKWYQDVTYYSIIRCYFKIPSFFKFNNLISYTDNNTLNNIKFSNTGDTEAPRYILRARFKMFGWYIYIRKTYLILRLNIKEKLKQET